jgi:hypothetical protein
MKGELVTTDINYLGTVLERFNQSGKTYLGSGSLALR